jgi:hypothetical protein
MESFGEAAGSEIAAAAAVAASAQQCSESCAIAVVREVAEIMQMLEGAATEGLRVINKHCYSTEHLLLLLQMQMSLSLTRQHAQMPRGTLP